MTGNAWSDRNGVENALMTIIRQRKAGDSSCDKLFSCTTGLKFLLKDGHLWAK